MDIIGVGLRLLIGIYLLLLVSLVVARFATNSRAMRGVFMTLFGNLLPLALLLLPVAIVLDAPWLGAALAVPPGIFAINYVPVLQHRADDDIPDTAVTVLSFNIEVEDDPDRLAELAGIIRETDADIVGLQELSPQAADYFADVLNDRYPHHALYTNDDYVYAGQGIFSRYDITEHEYWGYPERARDDLGHMRAEINRNGYSLVVYNTHPMPPLSFEEDLSPGSHEEAIDELLERASTEANPTLLIGDFNITQYFEDYNDITEQYGDAVRDASPTMFGFTFPDSDWMLFPRLVQLDYIFYSEHFTAHRAEIWRRSGNADHRPIRAILSLPHDAH